MMNPATMMKVMSAGNAFKKNHPRFTDFLGYIFSGGLPEGTVIEITVTKPAEEPVISNMRVTQSDLELFESLKDLGGV